MNRLCVSSHMRSCDFYVKMNQFKAYLMVLSRVIDSTVLTMAIEFEIFYSDKKAKWQM